jgi:hypothetical protein
MYVFYYKRLQHIHGEIALMIGFERASPKAGQLKAGAKSYCNYFSYTWRFLTLSCTHRHAPSRPRSVAEVAFLLSLADLLNKYSQWSHSQNFHTVYSHIILTRNVIAYHFWL